MRTFVTLFVGILAAPLIAGCQKNGNSPRVDPSVAKPAATTTTQSRKAFRFQYPTNWALVDNKDADYHPDRLFKIDSSDGSMIMFVILDKTTDPAETLATMVASQEKRLLRVASKELFAQWGKYDVSGMTVRGTAIGSVPCTIRLIAFNAGRRTFEITEYVPDDEVATLAPGFRTIENSFEATE